MSITLKDSACRRLSSSGLRQDEVHRIIDDVDRWIRGSGTEWVVDRLKALKLEAITTWSGNPVRAPWVRRNSRGRASGVWGRLIASTTARERQRALNALMLYSSAVSRVPTRAALEKFEKSAFRVTRGPDVDDMSPSILQPPTGFATREAAKASNLEFEEMSSDARSALPTSPAKRVPLGSICMVGIGSLETPGQPVREFGVPRSCSERDVAVWLPHELQSPVGRTLAGDPFFREWVNSLAGPEGVVIHPNFTPTINGVKPDLDYLSEVPIGKIGYIPEPGLKLRAVANPSRLANTHLRPLQAYLFRGLRGIPEDCTYDQGAGVSRVQGWLRDGHVVHCVDLSDATNHWPLSHTLGVLRGIGLPANLAPQVRAWVAMSRGLWETLDGSFQRWSRGQPLGLGPSFAAFAVSHHAVVQDAIRRAGEGEYVLLGDDIAIKGDGAAREYLRTLEALDVPVSPQKTISSASVAEFGGRVITPEAVLVAPKWREPSDRSFLDYVRVMGPKALDHLRPRQRRVAAAILSVSPSYGGLGMNPEGIPLYERDELGRALAAASGDQVYDLVQRRATRTAVQVRMGVTVTRAPSWMAAARDHQPARAGRGRMHIQARLAQELRLLTMRLPQDIPVPPGYAEGVSVSDPRGPSPLLAWERKLRQVRASGVRIPKGPPVSPSARPGRWHSAPVPPRRNRGTLGR